MKYSGIVQKGEGQATQIAIPTANIHTMKTPPKPGIYTAHIMLQTKSYNGIAYIGKAWLLQGAPERMEVHLFDYDGPEFYGESIEIELEDFIRDPIQFTSEQEATKQIEQDIKKAKVLLNY